MTPTILIGVGGIGCKIIEKVYDEIPETERKRVVIHGFDTNVNDIREREHLRGKITQTSTDKTVDQYLQIGDETIKDWFPHENKLLHRKPLTEGAGQIRIVSRLAYRAAIEENRLRRLDEDITELFRMYGEQYKQHVRVAIVCSIAGGTGAGIFLQTAFYIRDFLQSRFNSQVMIKGFFLLPDILIRTNIINDKDEHENMKTNAYASMKELDAFVRNSSANSDKNKFRRKLRLEYKPNQTDSTGTKDDLIESTMRAFDFAFMFDYENIEGRHLGSFNNYIDQVARVIKTQLFSPMSDKLAGEEDNKMLGFIKEDGMAIYSGAAVSALIYPYNDMLDFCSMKWIDSMLSTKWMKIDSFIKAELDEYERNRAKNIHVMEIDTEERFIHYFDELGKKVGSSGEIFFNELYESILLKNAPTDEGELKHEIFLEKVDDLINETVNSEPITTLENKAIKDIDSIKDKEMTRDVVRNREEAINLLYHEIKNNLVQKNKLAMMSRIFPSDFTTVKTSILEKYNINYWLYGLSGENNPLHPIAVRYFLYKTKEELKSEIIRLKQEKTGCENDHESYKTWKDEDNNKSNAVREADNAVSRSGLFNSRFKEYVKKYLDKSDMALRNLKKYKTALLKLEIYEELLLCINLFLEEEVHVFFKLLGNIVHTVQSELKKHEDMHKPDIDPSKHYIFDTLESKEALWNEISIRFNKQIEGLSGELYRKQYERYEKRRNGEIVNTSDIESKIMEDLKAYASKEIQNNGVLKLNIVKALKKEAVYKGYTEDKISEYIKDRIKLIDNFCHPYIPNHKQLRPIEKWGINSAVADELGVLGTDSIFSNSAVIDDDFADTEIIKYRSLYTLRAQDFVKFNSGNITNNIPAGSYYVSYMGKINELITSGNAVTPHLDKNWHNPGFMDDINDAESEDQKDKINKTLLLGLIYNRLIISKTNDGELVWAVKNTDSTLMWLKGDEGRYVNESIRELHKALWNDLGMVEKVNRICSETAINEKRLNKPMDKELMLENSVFVPIYSASTGKKNQNILDHIYKYGMGINGADDVKEMRITLLKLYINLLDKYFEEKAGPDMKNTVNRNTAEFLDLLMKKSEILNNPDNSSTALEEFSEIIRFKINNSSFRETFDSNSENIIQWGERFKINK